MVLVPVAHWNDFKKVDWQNASVYLFHTNMFSFVKTSQVSSIFLKLKLQNVRCFFEWQLRPFKTNSPRAGMSGRKGIFIMIACFCLERPESIKTNCIRRIMRGPHLRDVIDSHQIVLLIIVILIVFIWSLKTFICLLQRVMSVIHLDPTLLITPPFIIITSVSLLCVLNWMMHLLWIPHFVKCKACNISYSCSVPNMLSPQGITF